MNKYIASLRIPLPRFINDYSYEPIKEEEGLPWIVQTNHPDTSSPKFHSFTLSPTKYEPGRIHFNISRIEPDIISFDPREYQDMDSSVQPMVHPR